MANTKSAKKRIITNEKRRARNRWRLRAMRTAIKDFSEKLAHGSLEDAQSAFRTAASTIDKTAQNGVIHKNQAARRKSRLNAKLKERALAAK
ncbi:MAG: 30S ribosomal protein S20 [Phycisphaeraceae bacterium]|nr:30S ribosomal protein S20 [Phycisphaerales bacterium]MCB9858931.1 30S ribosomal protein S20 [Phycisphaeraceae bacterium]